MAAAATNAKLNISIALFHNAYGRKVCAARAVGLGAFYLSCALVKQKFKPYAPAVQRLRKRLCAGAQRLLIVAKG